MLIHCIQEIHDIENIQGEEQSHGSIGLVAVVQALTNINWHIISPIEEQPHGSISLVAVVQVLTNIN